MQNRLKLCICNASMARPQVNAPTIKNSSNVFFLPSICIHLVTGITVTAVPRIIMAIGAVAHEVEGASSAPTREPASTIRVMIDPPSALLMLSMQTFLKPGADMMLMGVDPCGWLVANYFATRQILDYFYRVGSSYCIFNATGLPG